MAVELNERQLIVRIEEKPSPIIQLTGVGLRGQAGYNAFQVWQLQPGNQDKTEADYLDWLANAQIDKVEPFLTATEAAKDAAQGFAASALASKNASALSADAAHQDALSASASKNASAVSQQEAANHRAIAVDASNAALSAKNLAETAATSAEEDALSAAASASAAQDAKENTEAFAISANSAAQSASESDIAAAASMQAAEDAKNIAVAKATAAEEAQAASEEAKQASELARDQSVSAKNESVTAKDVSVAASEDSVDAKVLSEAARDQASISASTAVTKAGEAANASADAIAAKNISESLKTAAQTFRNEAEQFRNEAEQFRDEASEAAGGDFVTKTEAAATYRAKSVNLETSEVTGLDQALAARPTTSEVQDAGDQRYYQIVTGQSVATQEWADQTFRRSDVALTKSDVGLSNVDNTADVDKPISTLQQQGLDAKLDDSQLDTDPLLAADSDVKIATQKATKSFVLAQVADLKATDINDIQDALDAQALLIGSKQDELGFTPANAADTYTKGEVDAALVDKADNSSVTDLGDRVAGAEGRLDTLEAINPVLTINGVEPDAEGNIVVAGGSADAPPSQITLERTNGDLTTVTETVDGDPRVTALIRENNLLVQTVTTYRGKTFTSTLNRVNGQLVGVTTVET